MSRRIAGGLRVVERSLFAASLVLLAWCALVVADAAIVQRSDNRKLDVLIADAERRGDVVKAGGRPNTAAMVPPPQGGDLLGRLEIPRLGMTSVVHEGVGTRTLQRGIGHIPATALPGMEGNIGLAAHRDTYFHRLKNIRAGDDIVLTTPEGRVRYLVRGTRIVQPDEMWVLDATTHATLTLVTCYPFNFIGDAPQRFVVRADRSDLAALPAGAFAPIAPGQAGEIDLAAKSLKKATIKRGTAKRKAISNLKGSRGPGPDTKAKAGSPERKRGFWKRLFSAIT